MAYWGNAPAKVAVKIGSDAITTTQIEDGQVYTADLQNDSVTATKIDDDGTGFQMGSLGLGAAVSGSHKLTVGGTATFSGAITGNLTGNASGTSATVTGATQSAITSVGTLTSLTVSGAPFVMSNTNNGNNIDIKTTSSGSLVHAVKIHSGGLFEAKQGISSTTGTFTGSVQISHGTTPDFTLNDTGGTTNKRVFRIGGGGDAIYFEGRNNGNTGDGAVGSIMTLSLSDASTTFAGQLKIDTDQRYFTKWETTYGTDRDYWWRNDGGLLQLGEGSEGDGNVKYTFDTANKRLGIGETSPGAVLEVTGAIDDNWAGRFENTHSGGYGLMAKIAGSSASEYALQIRSGSTHLLKVMGDGSATFSGDVNINGSYGSPSNKKFTKSVGGSGGTTELDFTVHTTSNNMHEPGFVRVTACATITNGSVRAFHDSIHFFRQYNGGFDDISEQAVTESSSLTSVASSSTTNELRVRITFDSSGYYWSSAGTAIIATIEATNMDGLVKIT